MSSRVLISALVLVLAVGAEGAVRGSTRECGPLVGVNHWTGCSFGHPASETKPMAARAERPDVLGVPPDCAQARKATAGAIGHESTAAMAHRVLARASGSPGSLAGHGPLGRTLSQGRHAAVEKGYNHLEDDGNGPKSGGVESGARQAGSSGAVGVLAMSLLGVLCVRRRHA